MEINLKKLDRIGQSSAYADIFRLDEDRIIKVPKYGDSLGITKEFFVQRRLFDLGIKVPQPFELTDIKEGCLSKLSLIMEYIPGKNADEFSFFGNKKMEVLQKYEAEIELCQKWGFKTSDEGLHNAIYSEERGLFLIDFEGWWQSS